jgi:uncharacterized repeat protein (TIGR01451 family)
MFKFAQLSKNFQLLLTSTAIVAMSLIIIAPFSAYAVINEAEIISEVTLDPDLSNNTAETADIPLAYEVDLEIQANVITTPIYPGLPVEFNFVITNNGPSTVTSVVVSGYNPVGINTPTYTLPNGATFSNGVISGINLEPGQSITLGVNAIVDSNVETDIDGNAVVAPDTGVTETNLANNEDLFTLPITPIADLSLTKQTAETSLIQGTIVQYTMVGTNNGPSTAQPNITITDTLPTQLSYDSVDTVNSSAGWTCVLNGTIIVNCTNTNPILNGETVTLVLNVLVTGSTSGTAN